MSTEDRLFESLTPDFRRFIDETTALLRTKCESEIEVMFGVAMFVGSKLTSWHTDFHIAPGALEADQKGATYLLMYQYPWNGFRIDWVFRFFVEESGQSPRYVFVECDGHDFHERTKEQAERDRSKDRAIQAAGIPIFRFTGREIYPDVGKCAGEVLEQAARR